MTSAQLSKPRGKKRRLDVQTCVSKPVSEDFTPKPFLCLEHDLLALLTHIVLNIMASNVFKVRINCTIVTTTKNVEEIIIAIWLLKKITEIPVKPGLATPLKGVRNTCIFAVKYQPMGNYIIVVSNG